MSRGDFGYGAVREYRDDPGASSGYRNNPYDRGSSGRGYQGAGGHGNYNALVDEISSNIFQISNNATMLDRSIKQIGSSSDSPQLRDRIHQAEQSTNKVINSTMLSLRQMAGILNKSERQQKLQYERLMNEFKEAVERYSTLQKKAADKVRSSVVLSSQAGPKTANLIGWGDEPEDDDQSLLANEQRRAQMMAEQEVLDNEVAYLQERENQIKNLESDILDINQIFRDLGALVYEQGEVVNTIESNVESAAVNVEGGNEQLEKAARYQRSARKKMCILVVILLVVAAIVTLIIVLSLKT